MKIATISPSPRHPTGHQQRGHFLEGVGGVAQHLAEAPRRQLGLVMAISMISMENV
jgi:hypothetical protein